MLSLTKPFKLKWWQIAIYELALISLGLVLGSSWPDIFLPFRVILLIVFILGAGYVIGALFTQIKEQDRTK